MRCVPFSGLRLNHPKAYFLQDEHPCRAFLSGNRCHGFEEFVVSVISFVVSFISFVISVIPFFFFSFLFVHTSSSIFCILCMHAYRHTLFLTPQYPRTCLQPIHSAAGGAGLSYRLRMFSTIRSFSLHGWRAIPLAYVDSEKRIHSRFFHFPYVASSSLRSFFWYLTSMIGSRVFARLACLLPHLVFRSA